MQASYAGVNVISSRSFIRPAMIRLELDGGGRRRGKGEHSPTLTPLLVFDRRLPPLVQISYSPQPSDAIKIEDGDHNFVKKILSTRSAGQLSGSHSTLGWK